MSDDGELLRRYGEEGAEEAFAELVGRHLDVVYSAALRQVGGDVHRARDVAQMVFTDLARKASALRGHIALVGWLYTSTHFAAAKLRRSEARRAAHEQEALLMHEHPGSAAEQVDWAALRPVLDATMLELKARDREALLLRFFEQRSFAEVGRHLGLGENAARMSVERALDKLGGLLARRGVTSTSAALSLVLAQQTVAAAPAGLAGTIAGGALAQAAAGGVGFTATLTHLMANTKLSFSAAGLAGLLATGVGVFHATHTARAAAAIVAIDHDTDGLRARLREVDRQQTARAAMPAPDTVTVKAAITPATSVDTFSDQFMHSVMNDPEGIRLRAQRDRTAARRTFGPLYQELGWSPAQIAQFETLLEAAIADDFRAQGGATIEGKKMMMGPEVIERLKSVRAGFEQQVRSAFGEEAVQRILALERSGDAHGLTGELAGQVYFTDAPLTPAQANDLRKVIEANSPQFASGDPVTKSTLDWERVLTQAKAVLTPGQLAALQALRTKAELEAKIEEVTSPAPKP